jgi:hypothetical protein
VFVCDNLAFNADVVIKRKHTVNGKHDLPGLIGAVIEPLALQREAQATNRLRRPNERLRDPKTKRRLASPGVAAGTADGAALGADTAVI